MPTAKINGIELYYETHGSGFPLVFIHGGYGGLGTGQSEAPPAWVERLAGQFEVILYDRRSSGRSGYPTDAHTMPQFANDVRELLRHLGHEKSHVWGISAGGPICMQFGCDHADAAQTLIISDTAPWLSRDEELLAALRKRIRILDEEGEAAAYEARRSGGTVGLNLFAAPRTESRRAASDERRTAPPQPEPSGPAGGGADAIRAQLAAIPREVRIAKYAGELRTYSAYVDWDFTERFRQLSMPVLVQYGTADAVFPGVDWGGITAGMANVTYKEYEGAGHGLAGRIPASLDDIEAFLEANS